MGMRPRSSVRSPWRTSASVGAVCGSVDRVVLVVRVGRVGCDECELGTSRARLELGLGLGCCGFLGRESRRWVRVGCGRRSLPKAYEYFYVNPLDSLPLAACVWPGRLSFPLDSVSERMGPRWSCRPWSLRMPIARGLIGWLGRHVGAWSRGWKAGTSRALMADNLGV